MCYDDRLLHVLVASQQVPWLGQYKNFWLFFRFHESSECTYRTAGTVPLALLEDLKKFPFRNDVQDRLQFS